MLPKNAPRRGRSAWPSKWRGDLARHDETDAALAELKATEKRLSKTKQGKLG